MGLFYLLKKSFKNLLNDSLVKEKSFENLPYLSSFRCHKDRDSEDVLERITKHLIRPCLHKSIRVCLPIRFTIWKLMAPLSSMFKNKQIFISNFKTIVCPLSMTVQLGVAINYIN